MGLVKNSAITEKIRKPGTNTITRAQTHVMYNKMIYDMNMMTTTKRTSCVCVVVSDSGVTDQNLKRKKDLFLPQVFLFFLQNQKRKKIEKKKQLKKRAKFKEKIWYPKVNKEKQQIVGNHKVCYNLSMLIYLCWLMLSEFSLLLCNVSTVCSDNVLVPKTTP